MKLNLGTAIERTLHRVKVREIVLSKPGIVQVTGANGSGKTTFLRYLASKNIKYISYLPQETFIFENLTICENLTAYTINVDECKFPYLLPAELTVNGSQLSGGEKRKLQLYIILNSKKKLIVLDEPFNHIDQLTTARLSADIKKLSTSKVIMIVDHNYHIQADDYLDILTTTSYARSDGSKLGFKSKPKIAVKYLYKNINMSSKIFILFGTIGVITAIFAIANNNNLSTATNKFTNPEIEQIVTANLCTGEDAKGGAMTDGLYLPEGSGIPSQLTLLERWPLSRNFVFLRKDYMMGAIKLDNPQSEVMAYDGALPIYDVTRFVYGNYPEDNTNQVAIPYFYARYMAKTNDQSIESLVGSSQIISNQPVVISGIFRDVREVKGKSIISSYTGRNTDCNPLLNDIVLVSNLTKVINIAKFTILAVLTFLIILFGYEYRYFRLLRLSLIPNKIINVASISGLAIMLIAIGYYINYP